MTRYPYHRRTMLRVGVVLSWLSLFAASYTTNVVLLVLFQGVLYAIGGCLLYYPCISYLSEWFLQRKGFANGVLLTAGTSAGGFVLPLTLLPRFIAAYGPSKTLRILSIAIAVAILPLLPFVKGRLPESRVHGPVPRGSALGIGVWIKEMSFYMLLAVNTVQGFGYFVPIVWLPTFARDLNLSSSTSSLTIALLNCGAALGRLCTGYLSDKINPWSLAFILLSSTSAATFVLWGVRLSYNLAGLLAFGTTYGLLASGWSSVWTGFTKPLTIQDPMLSTTLFGYLMFSRGIGSILSTPISSALSGLSSTSSLSSSSTNSTSSVRIHEHLGFKVGGGRFENMIIYVGTCFAGAALVCLLGWGIEGTKWARGTTRNTRTRN